MMILDFLSPQKGLFSSAFVKKLSERCIDNTMHTGSLSIVRQLKICAAKQRKRIITEVKNRCGFSVVLTKKKVWTSAAVSGIVVERAARQALTTKERTVR